MKKQDLYIGITALIIGALAFFLWFHGQMNTELDARHIAQDVILWGIILLCALLALRSEVRRRRAVRTFMVGEREVYNPELGMLELKEGLTRSQQINAWSNSLEYTFSRAPVAPGFRPWCVVYVSDYRRKGVEKMSGTVSFGLDKQELIYESAEGLEQILQ